MVNVEKDCESKCRSRQHAGQLLVAVSKGSVRQIQLFLTRCHNATQLSDQHGRTVLHIAASCGKVEIIEWLLSELGMEVSGKDLESGWTALHRALFYGQIAAARLLIAHGASTLTRDKEGLTSLDLIMKDRLPYVQYVRTGLEEVYTWGENSNFTLGHETANRRRNPEILDFFRKRNISIKQVAIHKYHSVFVSSAGQVYVCGHGRGGRLGLGHENTVLEPTLMESIKNDTCCQAVAAKDHSLFLMESGALMACGMNDYHQLGVLPSPAQCLSPKQVNGKQLKGKKVKGICAQRFHSVVYTDEAVFTFGLNAGQLGHHKVQGEALISQPRQVSALQHTHTRIELVTCSEAATVVYTGRGDVYVLHEYQCRKIVNKKLSLVQVAVTGGNLDHRMDQGILSERGGSELVIALLNLTGMVYLWRSSDPVMRRCSWATKRSINVTQISLNLQGLVFITKDGDAFTASLPKVKVKPATDKAVQVKPDKEHFDSAWTVAELVAKDDMLEVSIEKLSAIHRATAVVSDRKGRNFAVLQCQPNACLTEIPQLQGSHMSTSFTALLAEADCGDTIHDCVLQMGQTQIPAHRYILASKSEYFNKLFKEESQESTEDKPIIDLTGANMALFKQLLTFIYTDTCDILTVGKQLQIEDFIENGKAEITNTVDYIELGAGDEKKSAFQMYSSQKKNKKGGKVKVEESGKGDKTINIARRNPIQALQEMARKFGVKSLTKRLDAVKQSQGVIHRIAGRHLPAPIVRFDRHKYKHLYDVTLRCQDDRLIQAHRCVLVARLEYFRSMLASGWIETSTDEPLQIPVPGDIMAVIVDYLYADGSAVIDSCEDAEFLINVLVVADQLLMTRLREMCEVAITSQITLKNACELLELATFYHASQLRATCQQFICLNLAALLESRALDLLSQEVIDDLTRYYRQLVPGMEGRVIPPYSGFPYREDLQRLEAEAEASAQRQRKDSAGREEVAARKSKAKKKRTRTKSTGEDRDKRNSVGSDTDNRQSFCMDTKQALDEVSEESSPVDSPRQTEAVGKESVSHSTSSPRIIIPKQTAPSWSQLASPTSPSPPQYATPVTNSDITAVPQSPTSPELSSPCSEVDAASPAMDVQEGGDAEGAVGLRAIMDQQAGEAKSPSSKSVFTPKKKGHKLSQKERKRLAQEEKRAEEQRQQQVVEDTKQNSSGGVKPKAWASPVNPWGAKTETTNPLPSFKDLVIAEETQTPSTSRDKASKPITVRTTTIAAPTNESLLSWGLASGGGSRKQSFKSSTSPRVEPTSPRSQDWNPWQTLPSPTSVVKAAKTVSFTEIIQDETKQKETLQKVANKPLHLIQAEEKAIQELLAHYQSSDNTPHVKFSVERVPTVLASPTWAATQAARKS